MTRPAPIEPVSVRHYGPGGREHGGGIGRLIGYLVAAAGGKDGAHRVTDTRGPRLGPASPARLAGALLAMAGDRIAAPRRIHHLHVAGRGSTVRKLALAAWARALGCRHVVHLHDYDYAADVLGRPAWARSLVRRMFGGADRVIVLGERDRATATRLLGADPARVVVLHNGVPDPGPPPRRDGPPTILFLGRLSERKGVPELLDALAHPALAGRPWRAVLAGDGPVEDYRARARALGLGERVAMPGWLDEAATRELCRGAHVLVLPSHAEGMAMAVLEGLAHGLAVVTTRVGSHEEAITDGQTGVFVPVGDAPALARALAALLDEPRGREAMGRAGRRLFVARFSMDAYIRRLSRLYADLGAPARPPIGSELTHDASR